MNIHKVIIIENKCVGRTGFGGESAQGGTNPVLFLLLLSAHNTTQLTTLTDLGAINKPTGKSRGKEHEPTANNLKYGEMYHMNIKQYSGFILLRTHQIQYFFNTKKM